MKINKSNFAKIAFKEEEMTKEEEVAVLNFFFENIPGGLNNSYIGMNLGGFVEEMKRNIPSDIAIDYPKELERALSRNAILRNIIQEFEKEMEKHEEFVKNSTIANNGLAKELEEKNGEIQGLRQVVQYFKENQLALIEEQIKKEAEKQLQDAEKEIEKEINLYFAKGRAEGE